MTDRITTLNATYGYGMSVEQRNRVLRNTYWLLALSLVPTVLGSWFGIASGVGHVFRGGLGMILSFGIAFGLMYAIQKNKNSAAGVPILLGFTFFMGILMSSMIEFTLGMRNGSSLIMTAFGGTAGVFLVMASLSSVIKRDLSGMGQWLFMGVVALVIGSVINMFVGSGTGMLVLSLLSIGIFSAYMLYDIKRIIDGGETNYITATLSLYLDIINVFQNLLMLLTIFSGGDRD